MRRSVVYNPEIQTKLNGFSKNSSEIGLLIGQRTQQKDFVIHISKVPHKEEEGDNVEVQTLKKKTTKDESKNEKPSSSGSKPVGDSDSLPEDHTWICQYAREVTRTLPGGFDVLGIYVTRPVELTDPVQLRAKEILYSVFKTLKRDQENCLYPNISQGILLYICSTSGKSVCRTYDVKDYKSHSPTPAEWKPLSSAATWLTLATQLPVDFKFPIKEEDCDKSTKKQIEAGLVPFINRLLHAVPVINKVFKSEDEPLLPQGDSKKGKQRTLPSELTYDMNLVLPTDNESCSKHSTTMNCKIMYTFKGVLECRAFVHNKVTFKEAKMAMQQDIIRSLRARYDIHFVDFPVIEEEQEDPVVVHELPKRVFAPLSGILVSDYQFPADTVGDSLTNFDDLLGLNLSEEDILSLETFPPTRTLIQPQVNEDRLSEFGDFNHKKKSLFVPMCSATIAVIAVAISLFIFWGG